MKSRHIALGLVLFSVLAGGLTAQAQGKPMSLSDYVNAALKNNPLLGSAAQARASAEYNGEAIRKGYYPQIGIGSHLIIAPGYDQAVTNGGELGAQLSGAYVLYDGGARSLEIQKGGIGVEQGKINEVRTKADVIYSVSIAYVEAVKQKRELKVAEEDYGLLSDYLQLVRQLHASGQGNETDVLKTTVDLNNSRIEINARKVAYANALISLAQAAGLPVSEASDVDTSLTPIGYNAGFDASQNADLQSQELLLKQAQMNARIAGARLRPTVSLGADAGALTSLPNLQQGLANVFGASVGISVSVPVFTFGSLKDSYSAAEANAKSIALQNEYSRSALKHEFEATGNDIAKADSEIAALGQNLEIADQNLALSRAQYAGGSGLSLEVLNAIQMVNQIRLTMEEARASKYVSVLKMNRLNYTGAHSE